ncbi:MULTISPECIES: AmpG family muropeptide MFS transporter [unclassified Oceanobacter]|uniref:AmpG family muropeptide MFS transporter n=1 Tax=unclassified Oceanobacter TaxID=2620260 RepID=UPI002735E71F|nr:MULTISPECIES: AmpG family muropeptide MFS transporter [unclassified Oceanobacter]MDP2548544.1 AmpG family muropeptide MFS transporter [Oceanobacter sp. 4_MG-2023]MDP2608061.1 AmpG family muropeptide MFS transporter [Oceanobacter sp. 1_MG-2023]MDP2611277.1 AmpG family muropeptide MFS transporter [Oceanobacter sp. 2_MG-2023]
MSDRKVTDHSSVQSSLDSATTSTSFFGWWRDARKIYTRKPVLAIALLGFGAGLPFLLVFSTLTAWLRDAEVERTTIGFFAWIGMTYSIKVFWAPVVDRVSIPLLSRWLGQRRSWILVGQAGIASGLLWMSLLDPHTDLWWIAASALLVAFASSTQDVALDAYRIEAVDDEYQGAMSASYIFGYRVALLFSGAGALYLADWYSWSWSYIGMAALMLVGIAATFWCDEPNHLDAEQRGRMDAELIDRLIGRPMHLMQRPAWQRWLLGAVICPLLEFFQRNGWFALLILSFIAVFRLSDITMGVMANPFYLDMGYSKSDIARIAKIFGFVMTVVGSGVCGVMVVKWGMYRPLLLGAILVASTNLLFAVMAMTWDGSRPPLSWLAVVISADNLSGGIASTAFVAYLSSLANKSYTATQYALFSSLMTLPGKFISGFSGWVVDGWGYSDFFIIAAALGIPAVLLVLVLMKQQPEARNKSLPG